MKHYLIFVRGDVEPEVHGPFESEDQRDCEALELRRKHGDGHGYFPAVVYKGGSLSVGAYSSGFFAETDEA